MHRFAVALYAIGWGSFAAAADKIEIGPAPSWVQPFTLPAETDQPSTAAIKVLLQDEQLNFTPSTTESYVESVVSLQSPQGLSAMGNLTLSWKPDTDTLTVHKLRILRGGQIIDLLSSGQTFTTLRRENNLEYAALDGVLTGVMQPEGLQVGDVLELAYTLKRSDPVLAGVAEQIVTGLPSLPLSHVRFRARWPTSMSVQWKPSNVVTTAKEKRVGDTTEVTLSMDKIEPLVQPKGAPLRFAVFRQLEFSSFTSWADIAKRLQPLYVKAATLSPQSSLRAEVDRIRMNNTSASARAAATLALVQDQVRYVFLGMNDGGLVPADADVTWSRRFGDCKAKTTLLLALLHELDIEAEPVVVSSANGDGLNERLPMIALFDHVLVRAIIDGKTYWLDGTRTGDRRLEDIATPTFYWGLPLISPGAELVKIMPDPLTKPSTETWVRIDATAGIYVDAPFHAETIFRGDLAQVFKLQLANLTAADLDRGLREYWSKIYSFVDVQSVSSKFDERTGEELFLMDGTANMSWKDNWYETDGLGLGYTADFSRSAGPNRSAPFAVFFPSYSRVNESILLPNGGTAFTISGGDIDRTVAGVEYHRHAKIDRGLFTAEASARSIATEFPASEAESAQKILRDMAKDTLYLRAQSNYVLTDKDYAAELAKTPETADAYLNRGNLRLNRRDYDGAIDDFTHAIELNPKSDLALAERGIAYSWKRNSDLANKDFDTALALNPRNAVVFRGRGILAENTGNAREAIAAYSASLEIEARNTFALEHRAQAYAQIGDTDKALGDAAELIREQPTFIEMYLLRVSLYIKNKKPDEASAELNTMLAANPKNVRAYSSAGAFFYSMKKYDDATRVLTRAIEIEPSDATYLARARFRSKENLAGSQADIDEALKLNPRSVGALSLRASLQMDAGDYAKAISTYSTAISISDNYATINSRGIAYAKNKQLALAQKDFIAAQAKGSSANDFNNMCWNMAMMNVALDTALKNCNTAVSKMPDMPAYIDSLGFVLLRLGRYNEAIAAYDKALKISPNLPASLYCRGIAKRRKGDTDAGNADIDAALAASLTIKEAFDKYGVTP